MPVCLPLPLCYISQRCSNFTRFSVDGNFSDDGAIHYVLLVLWMTSYLTERSGIGDANRVYAQSDSLRAGRLNLISKNTLYLFPPHMS